MNNEIKEILEELENMYEISELEEQVNNINKIRDYITNLQQIEQEHKETNATLMSELIKLEEENERLKTIKPCMLNFQECYVVKDYKSRCEKAIEYIENPRHEMSVLTYQNLLNILQNGDDSQ